MAYMWIIWIVIAAIFMAGEVVTTGFFLFWFGVGAIVASILSLLGIGSLALQIIVFLAVSLLLVAGSRTILRPYLSRGRALKTGVETMIGEVVQVVEPSHGVRNEAAVRGFGSVWTAIPVEGEAPLAVGEAVRIDRVEGSTVYVYRPYGRGSIAD